jgi:hypothetical protein
MNLRTFRGVKSTYEPECRQLLEICQILQDDPSDEDIFLASNFRIASGEIDCLLLKSNGPILLELKSHRGDIFGSENGEWYVRTPEGISIPIHNNVFQQANKHRQDFLDKWQRIVSEYFSDIIDEKERRWVQSWAYFPPGSRYCDDKINFDAVPWFRIVTRDSLIQQFQFIRTGYHLYPKDMELIMTYLGLVEAPVNGDIPLPPDETLVEYLQFAQIYYEERNYPVAQRYIERCVRIDPGDKEVQKLSQLISQFLKE